MCFKLEDSSLVSATSPLRMVRSSTLTSPDQFVYSPASLLILLTALLGSRGPAGETRTQLAKGVYFFAGRDVGNELELKETNSIALYDSYLAGYTGRIPPEGTCTILNEEFNSTLCIANCLLYEAEFQPKEAFLRKMAEDYRFKVDTFSSKDTEATKEGINNWVKENTRGKIDNLLESNSFGAQTKMILINAIYFNGNWVHHLDALPRMAFQTDSEKFTVTGAKKILQLEYLKDEENNFRMVRLPFSGIEFSFLVFLPIKRFGTMNLPYSEAGYHNILKKDMKFENINFKIPEFKIRSEHDLKPIMIRAGVEDIFSSKADLSGISEGLYVSKINQIATIEFTRFGLEAAAATAIKINLKSFQRDTGSIEFHCDEPFSYALVDDANEKLYFIGRYNKPSE